MKGVLICGGSGTRLRPLTDITNKSLLPVYDRPLVEYPLRTLVGAGITEIAVISGTEHIEQMERYLGSGVRFGCRLGYCVQQQPQGIAQALGMAEAFVDGESVCAILGDNIYFDDLTPAITSFKKGGRVFLKEVPDAERFGVGEWRMENGECRIISIEEKPKRPKSNFAVTGCYLYDQRCFEVIRGLTPSARGEYEITDVSRWYLERGELTAGILQDEWIDAGTFESLFRAAEMVRERKAH